jgi:ankyrin repeat protein
MALMAASERGHLEVVTGLIAGGADVNAVHEVILQISPSRGAKSITLPRMRASSIPLMYNRVVGAQSRWQLTIITWGLSRLW